MKPVDQLTSARNCRHEPQGAILFGDLVITKQALNLVNPSLTAFTTAVRSAQIVSPYEAFSTLQPDEVDFSVNCGRKWVRITSPV